MPLRLYESSIDSACDRSYDDRTFPSHHLLSHNSVTMPRYKRSAAEAQLDAPVEPQISSEHAALLSDLRNMWEFASLMQYIFLFGHVIKIDEDFDIEVGIFWHCRDRISDGDTSMGNA